MLMDIDLPKFDIYQGTVAPYCLKSHTNFCCCAYFQKKVLSDVRPEIDLVFRNIVSTGHLSGVNKNLHSGLFTL